MQHVSGGTGHRQVIQRTKNYRGGLMQT